MKQIRDTAKTQDVSINKCKATFNGNSMYRVSGQVGNFTKTGLIEIFNLA